MHGELTLCDNLSWLNTVEYVKLQNIFVCENL